LLEEGNRGKELKPTDWIIAGEKRGTSLNLANLCSPCHRAFAHQMFGLSCSEARAHQTACVRIGRIRPKVEGLAQLEKFVCFEFVRVGREAKIYTSNFEA
jgi:hypothetical protein